MVEERFELFDDGEFCWIADKKRCEKTLKDFKQEIIDEGIIDEDYIRDLAEENYYDYLYDNTLTGSELVDLLNKLHRQNKKLRQENQTLKQLLKYIRK